MALPWTLFAGSEVATGNIVEDLEMGVELAEAGHRALLVEDAVLWSDPASATSTIEQRHRWEGGYLQSAAKWGPRLFLQSIRKADLRGLWAAVSFFIPPIAMLVLLDLCALVAAGLATWLVGAATWPSLILGGALIAASVAMICAWSAGGHRFITFVGLARVPLYLAWKIPMYLGFARRGAPKEWVRTSREEI